MIELIKPFGFYSFFSLFEYIKENGMAGEKHIALHKTTAPPNMKENKIAQKRRRRDHDEEVHLEVEYIKARAFDELYPVLPTAEEKDAANQARRYLPGHIQQAGFFQRFEIIPTRKNL